MSIASHVEIQGKCLTMIHTKPLRIGTKIIMNWKDKLASKAKELNLQPTKGGENERIRVRSSSNATSRTSSISRVSVSTKNKQDLINNQIKGGDKDMIGADGVFKDYEEICKKNISADEKLVEISRLILKLLLNIRTNQKGGIRKNFKKDVTTKPEVK